MKPALQERFSSLADILTADPDEMARLVLETKEITGDEIVEMIDASMTRLDAQLAIHRDVDMDTSVVFPLCVSQAFNTHTVKEAMQKLRALISIDEEAVYDKLVTLFHIALNMGMSAMLELEYYKPKPIMGDQNEPDHTAG